MTQQTLFNGEASHAAGTVAVPLVVCDRCGSDQFVETPIHNGQSTRCDCARCGLTMGFPVWYGRAIALHQRRGHRGSPPIEFRGKIRAPGATVVEKPQE